jgi:hypothetical protein
MKVAPLRRPPLSAHTHTHTPTPTLGCVLRMRAYVRIHMHALLIHTYARTHVPSRACLVRALTTRPIPRRRIGAAGVSAAAALTESSGSASRPPPAAPRARCCPLPCAPTVRPRRAAPAHPLTRAGRPRAPAMRARGSADGRRQATPPPPPHPTPRGAGPSAPAPQRHAQQRSARTAANAHGGGGGGRGTHSSSKSLHWPSHSGSALTFVEPMPLPRTARACGPRSPRTNGQTCGRTGRSHRKVTAHALNTHPHARDRHTGAFGAATVP